MTFILAFLPLVFAETQSRTELSNALMTESNVFTRPVLNPNDATIVTLGFELIHLINLIEQDQSITTKVWMRMQWKNELLNWNPEKFFNVTQTKLNREITWTPDIFLEEDVSEEISSGPAIYKTPIIVQYDGNHSWFVPVKLKSSCGIDVTYFPFDQQVCKLKFMSWTHDSTEIMLQLDNKPIITENYVNSSSWTLLGVDSAINHKKYACCINSFTDITFTVHLRRKPKYYVYNIILPCIIQMIVILFTFFLPPDCGERIGVVITVLLVFAVYLEIVSSSLPKTSNSTPTLSHFYITAMAESALSLIATCFILAIHFKGAEKGVPPMPDWARTFFIDCISQYVFVRKNLRQYTNEGLLALKEEPTTNGKVPHGKLSQDMAPQVMVLKQKLLKSKESDVDLVESSANMKTLIDEVRVITKLIHDLNRQDEIEEEWQILGKVLDRLFFIFFLLIFFFSSLLILMPVYMRH